MDEKYRLITMLIMTGGLFGMEMIVGYLTNSTALVADSFHMLSDVIALGIAYMSVEMSPKKWSKNTFGWARAEVLGALVNSVFLGALAFSVTVEALKRLFHVEEIREPALVALIGVIGLLVNLVGLVLLHDHSHSHGPSKSHERVSQPALQMNMRGVFLHVLADAIGSVIVIISASIIWLTRYSPCIEYISVTKI
jgi:zinc transporter 1